MNGKDSGFHPGADCCFNPEKCDWKSGSTWSCCTTDNPCKLGDGDCDYDSQCQDGYVCGRDNCLKMNGPDSGFHPVADCCKPEGKESEVFWDSNRGL